MLGVASLKQMRLYSAVYQNMGIDYAIVNSIDGYDEISLTGEFKIMTKYNEEILTPEDLGLKTISPSDLTAGQNVEEAARIFDEVLAGTAPESKKEVVVANAAIAINVLDKGKKSFVDCIAIARESLVYLKAMHFRDVAFLLVLEDDSIPFNRYNLRLCRLFNLFLFYECFFVSLCLLTGIILE